MGVGRPVKIIDLDDKDYSNREKSKAFLLKYVMSKYDILDTDLNNFDDIQQKIRQGKIEDILD